jgi:hypothetical protein
MRLKALLFFAVAVIAAALFGQERFDPNAVQRTSIAEFCAGFLTDEIVARHNVLHAELNKFDRNPSSLGLELREIMWDEIVKKEQSWQRLDCKGILYPNGAPQK